MSEVPAACPIPKRRRGLTRAGGIEIALCAAAIGATWFLAAGLSWSPQLGSLLAYSAAVFLGQGLIRDLARLAARRGQGKPTQKLMCLCAESTIGVVGLVAGLTLLGMGIEEQVLVTGPRLTAILAGLLGAGFVAKDYVLVVKRVEDHGDIAIG